MWQLVLIVLSPSEIQPLGWQLYLKNIQNSSNWRQRKLQYGKAIFSGTLSLSLWGAQVDQLRSRYRSHKDQVHALVIDLVIDLRSPKSYLQMTQWPTHFSQRRPMAAPAPGGFGPKSGPVGQAKASIKMKYETIRTIKFFETFLEKIGLNKTSSFST